MSTDFTLILARINDGDSKAVPQLFTLVYDELRRLAAVKLKADGAANTLQPTALVNEAFMKLAEGQTPTIVGRGHFFAIASRAMRQILVDYARRKNSLKRGGAAHRVDLSGVLEEVSFSGRSKDTEIDLELLDRALSALAEQHRRPAEVVELRYFGGLSEPEAAAALGISPRTAAIDWAFARGWLLRFMKAHSAGGDPP